MRLVMIHGRGQGDRVRDVVLKEWNDALGYGLLRASKALPSDCQFEFPYYGDILDALVQQLEAPLAIDGQARGEQSEGQDTLRGEMLEELAAGLGVTQADIERELAGPARARGPQNWGWVQAILRAVDRVPGLNSRFIDAFTRDVYVYLTFPGVRERIDTLVAAAIGSEPCVVLAHSLGTIVAYNVLLARKPTPPVARLITVGSPLGIRAIQRHLTLPLRSPPCIEHWFNAFDERDVVALRALDAHSFNVTPAIENKRDVRNHTDNRHGIEGYLADPVVASKIVEHL